MIEDSLLRFLRIIPIFILPGINVENSGELRDLSVGNAMGFDRAARLNRGLAQAGRVLRVSIHISIPGGFR